jgi:DNA repair protein SbcD/Mre11
MSNWPLRFVHASDFHLESPPRGVSEVPDHLEELFLDAPYSAAERVFETVLAEEARFLVLSGDVVKTSQSGPRGPLFLCKQFARLAERGIPVYWAGGKADPPDAWPDSIPLPENVHLFAAGEPDERPLERDGLPVARVVGVSVGGRPEDGVALRPTKRRGDGVALRPTRQGKPRARDFRPDPAGLPTLAVFYGKTDPKSLAPRGIHYWALGGSHNRSTPVSSPCVVHYPGSPQGRSLAEPGTHGCTLVELEKDGQARTSFIPTDVMRWLNERVAIEPATNREDLEAILRQRMQALIEASPGVDLLVSWSVAGSGPLIKLLGRPGLADELLGKLRSQFGYGPPAAWSLAIEVEPSAAPFDDAYDEETIRGDFVRAIRSLQDDPEEALELEPYLGELHGEMPFRTLARIDDPATRASLLCEAAVLGADLLSGEE